MKEIIVIRTSDPDGSVFHSILDILQGKDIQILHADSRKDSVVTLGGIQIFPEQRRVLNQGAEVHLNYGEFSILYCMAKSPEQVFSREAALQRSLGRKLRIRYKYGGQYDLAFTAEAGA